MRPMHSLALVAGISAAAIAQNPPVIQAPPQQQQAPTTPPAAATRRPRPYGQVVTDRAKTERGGITVHGVDDKWFLEIPDSLLDRDILLVSRLAAAPAGAGGFSFCRHRSRAARRPLASGE